MQMKKNNDLRGFAAISREIGHIAHIAGDIELTAINGMLMVKNSASSTTGFGVAAHEIQGLSLYFIEVTQNLSRLVYQMSYLVGNGMNLERRMRILNATAACHERGQMFISTACEGRRKVLNVNAMHIRQSANEVLRLLQRAERQCLVGIALGRAGKIEAVYGAATAGRLRQVATEVQDRMGEMMERLKSVMTAVQVWQA